MNARSAPKIRIDITIPSDTRYLGMVGRMGEDLASSLMPKGKEWADFPYNLNLVLTEAIANAIDHGNNRDPEKNVRILITASDQELVIKIYDQGHGFDLHSQSQKASRHSDEGGRGIHLMRELMDELYNHREDSLNVMILSKKLR